MRVVEREWPTIILREKHVLLCATYILPLESPYFNEDSFSILEGEINNFKAQGHVLVCGDLQSLAKVFGPLELCDLLPHFRLQT